MKRILTYSGAWRADRPRGVRRKRRRRRPSKSAISRRSTGRCRYYVATENKFWADAGLVPEFSTFPAGAPQVAAAQAKAWDVGGTGSVPAVLGAARFGLVTIGITNDESKANVLMVRADKFDAVKKDPSIIKGQKILLTTNSTGRLLRAGLPEEVGHRQSRRATREPGAGADHLGRVVQQRRLRGRLGAQQLHAGREGQHEAAVQRLRRRRDRARRADRASGLRQGEPRARSRSIWPCTCARGPGSGRIRRKRGR